MHSATHPSGEKSAKLSAHHGDGEYVLLQPLHERRVDLWRRREHAAPRVAHWRRRAVTAGSACTLRLAAAHQQHLRACAGPQTIPPASRLHQARARILVRALGPDPAYPSFPMHTLGILLLRTVLGSFRGSAVTTLNCVLCTVLDWACLAALEMPCMPIWPCLHACTHACLLPGHKVLHAHGRTWPMSVVLTRLMSS